tara:strand:+ start:1885 stop:3021 length:1137 start_codon:yes stop_codon:yes gene_type:complete
MHVYIERIFSTVARNLGITDYTDMVSSWIEWTYEAEKLIGSKDTFIQKESTYTSSGAAASGTIEFTDNPTSGDTITLNGVELIFRVGGSTSSTSIGASQSPNEITIGATLDATLASGSAGSGNERGLFENLSGNSQTGTGVYAASAANTYPELLGNVDYTVTPSGASTPGILTITAKDIGIEGNDYTLESNNTNAKISGGSLTGGKGIYRNQQLVLPKNIVKLLGVRVGAEASGSKHTELRKSAATHRQRVGKSFADTQQRAFRYYVDGNRLNVQHDNLDEITIVYLAYPTDMRGYPMVKEGHESAVAQYIMWQMKLIEFYNGKLPQYITKELEKRWYFLCGKARGDDGMPTSEELKQIGNMWNTLIPVKSSSGLINF